MFVGELVPSSRGGPVAWTGTVIVDGAYEDLTQETFEVLVRSRDAFRGDSPFRAYLYGIARNVLIGHIRRTMRHGDHLEPAEQSAIDPASEGSLAAQKPTQLRREASPQICGPHGGHARGSACGQQAGEGLVLFAGCGQQAGVLTVRFSEWTAASASVTTKISR